jgi:protein-S-isoprenylcysteine O-methyltransferase Ste14
MQCVRQLTWQDRADQKLMTLETIGYKVIFFGLLLGFILMRGIFALIAQRSGLSATFEVDDPASQTKPKSSLTSLIAIVCVLAVFISYAVIPENRNILIFHLPDWTNWLGLALGITSLSVQIWVHITLQKNWSAARKSGRNNIVITTGLYFWIRHPLYMALMLLLLSLFLISGFSLFFLITLLSIPLFITSARKEEAAMVRLFGDEYRNYMENTGRFFPPLLPNNGSSRQPPPFRR